MNGAIFHTSAIVWNMKAPTKPPRTNTKGRQVPTAVVQTRTAEHVRRPEKRILQFCRDNLSKLRGEQERIERRSRVHYPIMKFVDMYFWQIGYELAMDT